MITMPDPVVRYCLIRLEQGPWVVSGLSVNYRVLLLEKGFDFGSRGFN